MGEHDNARGSPSSADEAQEEEGLVIKIPELQPFGEEENIPADEDEQADSEVGDDVLPPPEAPTGAGTERTQPPGRRKPRHEQRIKALPKPMTPTKEERERHELTHANYVPWCAHCVK